MPYIDLCIRSAWRFHKVWLLLHFTEEENEQWVGSVTCSVSTSCNVEAAKLRIVHRYFDSRIHAVVQNPMARPCWTGAESHSGDRVGADLKSKVRWSISPARDPRKKTQRHKLPEAAYSCQGAASQLPACLWSTASDGLTSPANRATSEATVSSGSWKWLNKWLPCGHVAP